MDALRIIPSLWVTFNKQSLHNDTQKTLFTQGEIPMARLWRRSGTEHVEGPAVVRVAEMVGISTEGWEDAARQMVALASRTIRHVTGLDLTRSTAVVRDGKITEYHVTAKVAFIVEPADVRSTKGTERCSPGKASSPTPRAPCWRT